MDINKYLADFQFVGNSIKSVKIKNDFIVLDNSKKFKRSLDVSHSIRSIERNSEEERILGIIQVNIKVQITSEKKKFALSMTIEGCFDAPIEMEEDDFRRMLQVNGVTSLYSISRAFVQSTSSQLLASGCISLPMLNVAAYSKDLDCNVSDSQQDSSNT